MRNRRKLMYNHVLFDADNTLLDFDRAQFNCLKILLEKYGFSFSNHFYQLYEEINHSLWFQFEQGKISKETVQEKRFEDFFSLLGVSVDGAKANNIYQEGLCTQSWLVKNAEGMCKKLFPYATLSIVTNGVGKTQKARIYNSKINDYITHIIISETIGYAKPSIQFFNETFKIIGRKPSDSIIIVGDSISSDIIGGINAGIDTCWYNPNFSNLPNGVSPNFIISDLDELVRIVLNR